MAARRKPSLRGGEALLGMSARRFLEVHWQKKPLVVRGAFPSFRDPVTPDELAGLACEDGVESRLVREDGGREPWEVTFGPHEAATFAEMPDHGWTLLVQDVNRHVPGAALLLEPFSFLPNVRVDDVMVSFAAPGGSVGPHVDSYDVFLVQGRGERRWRFSSKPTRDVQFVQGLALRILERFEPDVDVVLGPGDMLYLPPGFGHHGVATSACLTYSIGFRAPSRGEIWREVAAFVARAPGGEELLTDPPLSPAKNPGEIPPLLRQRVRQLVRSMAPSDETIDRWFASFATRLKAGHELEPPSRPPPAADVLDRLGRGARVERTEEGRWAYLPRGRRGLFLYVAGVEIEVPQDASAMETARALCQARRFDGADLARRARSQASRALIVRLFQMGALRFSGRPRASAR
jgi:50S ribosomal protein L16 3-hydroxylase